MLALLTATFYSCYYSKQKRILTKEELMALRFSKDSSIVITKQDKGNGVFTVKRHDCVTKMKQLISDGTKLKLLSHNTTKSRENTLTSYLRNLKRDGN